jgi:hypothetical protein
MPFMVHKRDKPTAQGRGRQTIVRAATVAVSVMSRIANLRRGMRYKGSARTLLKRLNTMITIAEFRKESIGELQADSLISLE